MINLIFNILTLVVVILLGIYIFKRYFLSTLYNSLNKEVAQKNDLIKEQNDLIFAQNDLDQSIKMQQKECANLSSKVDQWKGTVDKNKEEDLAKYQKDLAKFKEKLDIESNNYNQEKIRQELTPYVIDSLKDDLESYFDKEKNVHKFFGYIMNNMNKSKFE